MSSPAIYPKFHAFDPSTGLPLVGGKLTTYAAGTSTPLATYSDAALTTPNANPVILDANGEAVIYVGPNNYKFVLTKSDNSAVWTFDNYAPNLAFPSPAPSGWVQYTAGAITFINTTNFSVPGDATSTFSVGRRIRSSNTAGTIYSTISASAFGAGITTVTLISDSGALDSGLSAVYYGIETYSNPSYLDPLSVVSAYLTANVGPGFAAKTAITTWTEVTDLLNEFAAGVFTAKYAGQYLVTIVGEMSDTVAATSAQVMLQVNGSDVAGALITNTTAAGFVSVPVTRVLQLAAGDTVRMMVQGTANTTLYAAVAGCIRTTRFDVTRVR